jgi:hypothetical protein
MTLQGMIQIAADDVSKLRKCDVFRVLDTYREYRYQLAAWIGESRPDLEDELDDCMAEIKAAS